MKLLRCRTDRVRDVVLFTDPEVQNGLAAASEGKVLVGLTDQNVRYWVSWEVESPHIGVCMAAGMGQTVLIRSLLMQHLRGGGQVLMLDPREVGSQAWCQRLPGVRYAHGAEDITTSVEWLRTEMTRRSAALARSGGLSPVAASRLLVVTESTEQLGRLGMSNLAVLNKITMMGRLTRVHTLLGMRSPMWLGSARENVSTWIMGGASRQAWRSVGVGPVRSSGQPGSVHVVATGRATPVQLAFVDEAEALAHAVGGWPA